MEVSPTILASHGHKSMKFYPHRAMFVRQRVAPKMFSISREARRSLTFCVKPDGIPPHLRKRFQISTLKLPVCPFKRNADRSDPCGSFAPAHTVQATFIAHGVPWDKSLLLIQLLQSLVNCYKVNCFQSCFGSPFVKLGNLGRCPAIE